ncbi:Rieske 2Fe-2S domain-containing protein [Metallosphaera tengchongensis]|uniref:Rieske 2Fe-2S domain-containing protein n=1 Tax=Metallosphaera tengchongensis TaxID=1532350 RepID=A0A6N0NYN7_9CREN|nr:Rieske 2Fe-2S domain-containing protein [Metallosphaera tengchongensis]QKR00679.1 Rieske 2Fe-2S domain-containing protein [Metallosphaera tengchongensis]
MSLGVLEVDGYPVMVYRKGGIEYMWLAGCPHKKRPILADGHKIFDDKIECPFHRAVFSLVTGEMVIPPDSKTPCSMCRLIKVELKEGRATYYGEPFFPELPKGK